jgi:hypothetical protein
MIALMSRQGLFSLGSVVIAELAGATGDVGYQLQQEQQAFDVAGTGLHAATGVLCDDRAGRVDADRKYRASLTSRVGPHERYRDVFEAAIRTPASCARNSPRLLKEKPGTNHLCWDNKAVMITEKPNDSVQVCVGVTRMFFAGYAFRLRCFAVFLCNVVHAKSVSGSSPAF